jgi:hypothetical protein
MRSKLRRVAVVSSLAVAPTPPGAGPGPALLEIRDRGRPVRADEIEHALHQRRLIALRVRNAGPDPFRTRGGRHAPAEQPVMLDRDERGHVTPIFEQMAALAVIGTLIEQTLRIGAEPREQRQVMRAFQDVDGVDLEQSQLPHQPLDLAAVDQRGRCPAQPLRGNGEASRRGGA